MALSKHLPKPIIKTLGVYAIVLVVFFVFRLVLFLTELGRIDADTSYLSIKSAFVMGIRFDTVIAAYVLALPFLLFTIGSYFKKLDLPLSKIAFYWIFILFFAAFSISAADIPYFNQFFARFSITAFEWMDSPKFVVNMILQEPKYWLIVIPLIFILVLFFKVLKRITLKQSSYKINPLYKAIALILFAGFIFIGIRGRIAHKSPIRVGTAYFSNNAFLNQLGLNPNFTFLKSYLNSKKAENKTVQLMESTIALQNVQSSLGIDSSLSNSPISRNVHFNQKSNKYNVVYVIMEGMSAAKMGRHGNPHNLTPFLDSLCNEGIYFENTYSAGIHTFNGVFGTLFSMPSLYRQHPMKGIPVKEYHGIFENLKQHNYSSIYFTTHDGQFDNIEGFLKANYCDEVISSKDYPSEEIKTTLGVPDDYLFEFAIPKINKMANSGNPFIAALMTASDHGPYYIPPYFKPNSKGDKNQIVEYADYSLKKFIKLAKQQTWYNNTLFVFIADHGAPLNAAYDMPLAYNHSPLLFFCPNLINTPQNNSKMAGQIDIFPTTMGLLNLPYQNNTLGIDLLSEYRPYIYCNGDDKLGVLDSTWYLIANQDGFKGLYKYRTKDKQNYADQHPSVVDKMYNYGASNLQVYQDILLKNQQQ